ncbi:MAG: LysR family transcriptional regulator [Pseudomonadota bacterium]
MRFQKLDLNLLLAFDVLLAERSITKAAAKLNLTQSATSSILARLREYFDDPILVYVGRTMVPSELAMMLQEPIHKLLKQIQCTLELRPHFVAATSTRHFRVIASDYTVSVVLSRVIQQLAMEASNVTMEIVAPSKETLDSMVRGEVDLSFLPRGLEREGQPSEVLFTETHCCVVWASNTLVRDHISLEQYLAMGHVAARFAGATTTYEDQFFQRTGNVRKVQVTAGSFTALPQLLIGTNRVATLQTRLAQQLCAYFPIRMLPLPYEQTPLDVLMQWHSFVDQDPAHRWLRAVVKGVCETESLPIEGY